ncbi:MAG: 16S rRNA (guanine(966)-N(2))-methyltransferase RsmD [Oscillospiraceae bacterium]|nr:16S rRNA (guanine(966)-N(2))-methyltransferase RsmD [Oscillospiraceae bacterium]
MRVISGTARGRRLKEPVGMDIRPTTDLVKESLFNIIQFDIENARVLDMFAGTGQLGIEALSRGAESAVFIDESAAAIKIIGENVAASGMSSRAKVLRADALKLVGSLGKFDLIFLDPPYDTNLIKSALGLVLQFDILNENGIIIAETRAEYPSPEIAAPYSIIKEYKYGRIKLIKYGRSFAQK